jgi:hypothetical protein
MAKVTFDQVDSNDNNVKTFLQPASGTKTSLFLKEQGMNIPPVLHVAKSINGNYQEFPLEGSFFFYSNYGEAGSYNQSNNEYTLTNVTNFSTPPQTLGSGEKGLQLFVTFNKGVNPKNDTNNPVTLVWGSNIFNLVYNSGKNVYDIQDGEVCQLVFDGSNFVVFPPESANVVNANYSVVKNLKDNANLIPGILYRIADFITSYKDETGQQVNSASQMNFAGVPEPLYVYATSENSISKTAYSELFPTDIIHYTLNNYAFASAGKGKITYRKDTQYNIEADFDFRGMAFPIWFNNQGESSATGTLDADQVADDFVRHYYSTNTLTIINSGSDINTSEYNGKPIEVNPDFNTFEFYTVFGTQDRFDASSTGSIERNISIFTDDVEIPQICFPTYFRLENVEIKSGKNWIIEGGDIQFLQIKRLVSSYLSGKFKNSTVGMINNSFQQIENCLISFDTFENNIIDANLLNCFIFGKFIRNKVFAGRLYNQRFLNYYDREAGFKNSYYDENFGSTFFLPYLKDFNEYTINQGSAVYELGRLETSPIEIREDFKFVGIWGINYLDVNPSTPGDEKLDSIVKIEYVNNTEPHKSNFKIRFVSFLYDYPNFGQSFNYGGILFDDNLSIIKNIKNGSNTTDSGQFTVEATSSYELFPNGLDFVELEVEVIDTGQYFFKQYNAVNYEQ